VFRPPDARRATRRWSAPPTTSEAGAARRALLSDILALHHAAGEFVGARIALRNRDGAVTEVTAGTTAVDPASRPVDPDVAWNIGSVTKTLVAVVVLHLAQEGRIDLDAGIDRFVPDRPGADRITPRQLLQHTSGLGEYITQPALQANMQRAWTPSELIAVAEAAGRVGEPGGPHHYSNANYVVLGEIIKQVTGHSWADEVRTRIVEPLGLTHTSEITDERPVGYTLVNGSFVDATFSANPSVGGAAGALQSTDGDLLRFATALADDTLLSPASQTAMQTFVPGEDYSQFGIHHGYGLGLEQYANDAITVNGHMGTCEAQSAYVGYDTEHGTAVAVMTNTALPGPQAIMAVETLIPASRVS
jgi:D-alanyl-D-alanine carboxypeptidase